MYINIHVMKIFYGTHCTFLNKSKSTSATRMMRNGENVRRKRENTVNSLKKSKAKFFTLLVKLILQNDKKTAKSTTTERPGRV